MARDESRYVDRRRAAIGLARALARPVLLLGVGVPSAVAGRMARALRGWGQSRRCRRIPLLAPRRWRQAEARVRTVRRMARVAGLSNTIVTVLVSKAARESLVRLGSGRFQKYESVPVHRSAQLSASSRK